MYVHGYANKWFRGLGLLSNTVESWSLSNPQGQAPVEDHPSSTEKMACELRGVWRVSSPSKFDNCCGICSRKKNHSLRIQSWSKVDWSWLRASFRLKRLWLTWAHNSRTCFLQGEIWSKHAEAKKRCAQRTSHMGERASQGQEGQPEEIYQEDPKGSCNNWISNIQTKQNPESISLEGTLLSFEVQVLSHGLKESPLLPVPMAICLPQPYPLNLRSFSLAPAQTWTNVTPFPDSELSLIPRQH